MRFLAPDAVSRAAALMIASLLAGCVSFPPPPPARVAPALAGDALIARDGARLGLSSWPAARPKAVVLAVHGMNDYAGHFKDAGRWLAADAGITVYAYDQRGFGRSPEFGRWPGLGALTGDLADAIAAIRARHGRMPLYVLGHSMGAAAVMAAAADAPLDADGAILVAPGVWGRSRMPLFYRASLNVGASLFPAKTLTGERAGRQSTDNIPVLREMMADPYVIKDTRLDAILGAVRAMGRGWDASDEIGGRILFLYGEKDEIIPLEAMQKAAARLCGDVDIKAYAEGWHLLLRDLQAQAVWRDIAGWIAAGENAAGPGFGPAAMTCADATNVAVGVTVQRSRQASS
jgi:alpha-beta hydrolase superfamily lysophospholipase